jgi:hypothetical protein
MGRKRQRMSAKQVPLIEVARLRQERRQLRTKVAILEAENQGLLVENARLISALQQRPNERSEG